MMLSISHVVRGGSLLGASQHCLTWFGSALHRKQVLHIKRMLALEMSLHHFHLRGVSYFLYRMLCNVRLPLNVAP